MKFKTTKKAMRENYNQILSIGYCNAYHLLRHHTPIAYSTRAEGWACDYYDIDGVLISTGYSPIGKKCDYETVKHYDDLAKEISQTTMDWNDRKNEIDVILKQFVKALTN